MRRIVFDLFPGGKRKCVTFSYDDGMIYDKRLVEILDRFGAKGTFNLNAKNLTSERHIDKAFIKEISNHHEIACHAYTHPFLERLPVSVLVKEIYEEKKVLEDIIEKPIIGMAYPFGTYDSDVETALKANGIKYCRTVRSTNGFTLPDNYLEWHPSCHHNGAIEVVEKFFKQKKWHVLPVFYIWGHSYEFNDANNWEVIENLLTKLSEDDNIWYATNGEIYDYMQAIKELRVSISETSVYNPSAVTVYATVDDKQVEFKPGLTIL